MEITLKLTAEEVNFMLSVFGQMPNSSNTYILMMKIKEQGTAQVKAAQAVSEPVQS